MYRVPTIIRRLLAAAFVLGTATATQAAPVVTPLGLNPGDTYRLAFITSGYQRAEENDIAFYNQFVTDIANGEASLASLGTTWMAIGSTATVDARDNTNTNPGTEPNAIPIYLLDGATLVSSDHRDIWINGIGNPINIDETGNQIPESGEFSVDDHAWTGTAADGTAANNPLGLHGGVLDPFTYEPSRGDSFETQGFGDPTWLFSTKLDNVPVDTDLRFYALSDILTVASGTVTVSAPPALWVFSLALAGMAVFRRRRAG